MFSVSSASPLIMPKLVSLTAIKQQEGIEKLVITAQSPQAVVRHLLNCIRVFIVSHGRKTCIGRPQAGFKVQVGIAGPSGIAHCAQGLTAGYAVTS